MFLVELNLSSKKKDSSRLYSEFANLFCYILITFKSIKSLFSKQEISYNNPNMSDTNCKGIFIIKKRFLPGL